MTAPTAVNSHDNTGVGNKIKALLLIEAMACHVKCIIVSGGFNALETIYVQF